MKQNFRFEHLPFKNILDERQFIIPTFQRSLVWSFDRRKKFIDNVRNGDPFGVMLIQKKNNKYQIVDGLQRVTTLKDYVNNKFSYLDPEVLDKELLRKTITLNLEAQGLDPTVQNETYYEKNIEKLREVIFNSLKNGRANMGIISDAVNELGFVKNEEHISQTILDICDKFRSDTSIDDLDIFAIEYFGAAENIPNIFYNLNTGAVSLTKYETYAALWSNNIFKISDPEILDKISLKYRTLAEDSELEVDFDEDSLKEDGISLFEYCFALGQIVKKLEVDKKFISNSKTNNSKTDPIGFELLTLAVGEQINRAELLQKKLGACNAEFLISLKKALKDSCAAVFDAISPFVISLNKKSLLTDNDYLLYHMIISYFKEYYFIDPSTNVIKKNKDSLPVSQFKKYAKYSYLYQVFSDYWKIHRQVSDLSQALDDDKARHVYWYKVSDEKWQSCFVHFFEQQEAAVKIIPKNNKLFIDVYTKLNLTHKYPQYNLMFYNDLVNGNNKDLKLDFEHITSKKRLQNVSASLSTSLVMSRVGNLCYLTFKDNRAKGKKTVYEFIKDRPTLTVSEDYLQIIDYPQRDELDFIDLPADSFINGYQQFTKNRENRMFKEILDLLKKDMNK